MRVAVPSRGRLRDGVVALLDHAGYRTTAFRGLGARATVDGIDQQARELGEPRPRLVCRDLHREIMALPASRRQAGRRDRGFLEPALEHAVIGNIVPDFPLINKSFNLSYSGADL